MVDDIPQDGDLAEVFPAAVRAVRTGDVELLAELLHEYPGLANARSMKGRTLLNHACDWPGHFPRVVETGRLLIASGADVNARAGDPDKGETPLQWAVSSNDVPMAELLIESGASVNGLDHDLRPLAQSLFYGNHEVAEMLVRRGAAMTLEFAAGLGRIDLLPGFFGPDGRLLPQAGPHTAPINNAIPPQDSKDERLEQALIYALINLRIDCVTCLLDYGADVNVMPTGFHFLGAPLHWAAHMGQADMVELLVNRGADIHAPAPKDKATPLSMAEHRKNDETARLLKKLGATR
ncbi:ankyrin repeat domain-containing protein [Paenibacillus filicis]|uniref:Ankyrin repeat domain-containing protein n=1 Tax=Paenibacillus gyeongsangnamensis TaxID=3388067 RepID=A0ABT4Q8R7_9BACL|nr:ankyrin repeat domain-containing protein [Paenibacillus filicis]MCZ8513279.1 ankyrin repeat domain-containing protein [Paenibacillus filicis]